MGIEVGYLALAVLAHAEVKWRAVLFLKPLIGTWKGLPPRRAQALFFEGLGCKSAAQLLAVAIDETGPLGLDPQERITEVSIGAVGVEAFEGVGVLTAEDPRRAIVVPVVATAIAVGVRPRTTHRPFARVRIEALAQKSGLAEYCHKIKSLDVAPERPR